MCTCYIAISPKVKKIAVVFTGTRNLKQLINEIIHSYQVRFDKNLGKVILKLPNFKVVKIKHLGKQIFSKWFKRVMERY